MYFNLLWALASDLWAQTEIWKGTHIRNHQKFKVVTGAYNYLLTLYKISISRIQFIIVSCALSVCLVLFSDKVFSCYRWYFQQWIQYWSFIRQHMRKYGGPWDLYSCPIRIPALYRLHCNIFTKITPFLFQNVKDPCWLENIFSLICYYIFYR